MQNVSGYDYRDCPKVVDVRIGQIRKKIKIESAAPSCIKTIRNVGYKFEVDVAFKFYRDKETTSSSKSDRS